MYTTITLISLLNNIGTIAFVIEGTLNAKKTGLNCFFQFLSGMSTAFFGGIFLRDIILLQTIPAVFDNPLEITVATAICIITIIVLKYKKLGNIGLSILCLLDSIGIVGSVATGYSQDTKAGILLAFACGFVTACGGGIIATAIQIVVKKNFKAFFTILNDNKWYYLLTVSVSAIYGILHLTKCDTDMSILELTATTIIIGFIVERNKVAQR